MPIQLLPPQLANQIAAGEVVERPASVVKELIENALDAGARKIELDIERGGHKRIKIRDDGGGISKDELQLALSRHATSKIASLDDLEQILSLGFRGEALASISSVSRLTLTSKPPAQEAAWQASCEGREMAVTATPAAHPDGTTIDVADLFYNTPARRKFLRTEKTEFQHIDEVVKRIALSHPQVSFVLRHNQKTIRRFAAVRPEKHSQRLAQVVGQKFIDHAIHVQLDHQGMQIQAWLGNHTQLRSSTDCQYSFVNNRGMRDKLILHAIRQAYTQAYGDTEQPAFVFYLTVAPKDVDVNVHPAKHEVRFQQSRLVHDFICKAVSEALLHDDSDSPVSRPVPVAASHDYSQPLQTRSSAPDRPVAPSMSSGVPQAPAGGTRTSGAPGQSAMSSRVGGSRRAEVSEHYQQQFSRLMTPDGDSEANQALPMLALSASHRLFQHNKDVVLLNADELLADWWAQLLQPVRASQPLLMPVAIDPYEVSQQTIDCCNELGFVIQPGAGKLRLQQVPAGCRHLPWVRLFSPMMELQVPDAAALPAALAALPIAWPDEVYQQVWQWFDNSALAQQHSLLAQAGQACDSARLIQHWGRLDG